MVKGNYVMTKCVHDIMSSKAKISLPCAARSLSDVMNYGFSYIEHEDHIVEFIVANNKTMKQIFGEVEDSELNPEGEYIGDLWTAKLLLSPKLQDKQIVFSNNSFSVVINLDLDINPDNKGA